MPTSTHVDRFGPLDADMLDEQVAFLHLVSDQIPEDNEHDRDVCAGLINLCASLLNELDRDKPAPALVPVTEIAAVVKAGNAADQCEALYTLLDRHGVQVP